MNEHVLPLDVLQVMAVAWANVALGEKSVSNEADRIANDLMIGMKGLDIKEREMLFLFLFCQGITFLFLLR